MSFSMSVRSFTIKDIPYSLTDLLRDLETDTDVALKHRTSIHYVPLWSLSLLTLFVKCYLPHLPTCFPNLQPMSDGLWYMYSIQCSY